MGFNIKNNYGPNIEVNDGGKVTLVQGKNGLWHAVDAEEAEYEEVKEASEVKEEESESSNPVTPEPALNFFAPKKNLQELVLEDWFEGVCVDKKTYSKAWREKLVSDLMASEHGGAYRQIVGTESQAIDYQRPVRWHSRRGWCPEGKQPCHCSDDTWGQPQYA